MKEIFELDLSVNQRLRETRESLNLRQEDVAEKIKLPISALPKIEKGKQRVPSELIFFYSINYDVSADWILTGKGNMLHQGSYAAASKVSIKEDFDITGSSLRILTVTVDKDNNERITYVPLKAAAGYMNKYQDPEYIGNLPTFNLPRFADGTYRAFEVDGDSMENTIFNGDVIVCKYVKDWRNIKDKYIYLVIGRDGIGIEVKRLINKIEIDGSVIMCPDNEGYPPKNVKVTEIAEIWEVKGKISTNLPLPDQVEKRLKMLEDNMSNVAKVLQQLANKK